MEKKVSKRGYGNYRPEKMVLSPEALVLEKGCSRELLYVLSGESPSPLPFGEILLGEGSSLSLTVVVLPGVSVDVPLKVYLSGQGADFKLGALYLSSSAEKVSFSTDVRHLVGGCTSLQNVLGLAGGQSRIAFRGNILVAPDAQKTEAYQTNRNILLGEEAHVDTTPQLEIYADDVKCSHGATIGALNEEERFYMRSRGIPENEAKVLQMISFSAPALEGISDEKAREALSGRIEEAIREMV